MVEIEATNSQYMVGMNGLQEPRYIIPEKLAFIAIHPDRLPLLKRALRGRNATCISSDYHRQYTAFCSDFGPVNLGVVHRFCRALSDKLVQAGSVTLIYCIEPFPEALANACFLLAAFLLLRGGCTPAQAAAPFVGPNAPFPLRPFRDATFTTQVSQSPFQPKRTIPHFVCSLAPPRMVYLALSFMLRQLRRAAPT